MRKASKRWQIARILAWAVFLLGLLVTWAGAAELQQDGRHDDHSYSNPEQVRVRSLDLDLQVQFEKKILAGSVVLQIEKAIQGTTPAQPVSARDVLVLDSRDLNIQKVDASADGKVFKPASFELGVRDKILGAPLRIHLMEGTRWVKIAYSTSPQASALQWLTPRQTAGKQRPFLFTQSEAVHARSWIPLQDSPQVRVTYTARIRVPRDLMAVMSAKGNPQQLGDGDYRFKMDLPIPSYLIALAVGDLRFMPVGKRTGVYAETSVVEKAAREFEDMEKMVEAAEALYGPYRWGRYDVLVLPPSFPMGGMENPCLTFATPTVLAGDKSLVSLVAHELAHSWSGNLVTNATWPDLWLNEGFTVYVERRLVEAIYGVPRRKMEAVLGRQDLENEMAQLDPWAQVLHIDLKGRDPDDGFSNVPYEKGALFLLALEEAVGRPRFDVFLKNYFDHFAFQSITTSDFLSYLNENLVKTESAKLASISLEEWMEKPGLPASAPQVVSERFDSVKKQANQWSVGNLGIGELAVKDWSAQEWLRFLRTLPSPLEKEKMAALDSRFHLIDSGNAEIAHQGLLMSIRSQYEPASARLENYLMSIGRLKLILPLYQALMQTPAGQAEARRIYQQARPLYHPLAAEALDKIVPLQP